MQRVEDVEVDVLLRDQLVVPARLLHLALGVIRHQHAAAAAVVRPEDEAVRALRRPQRERELVRLAPARRVRAVAAGCTAAGCSLTTVASLEYEGRLFVASRRPERVLEHGEEGGAVFLPEERRHVVELDLLRLHVPRQPHLEPLEHGRALLVLA